MEAYATISMIVPYDYYFFLGVVGNYEYVLD